MASKNGKQTTDAGFLLAAYDLLGDISIEHSVSVGYQITPTVRRGVYKVRLSALRAVNGAKLVKDASYEREFPTAEIENLGAALFQAAVQIERILDSKRAVERAQGQGG
jgi:hypothetical protein